MLQSRNTESSIPCWIMPTVVVRPRANLEGPRGTLRNLGPIWQWQLQCVPYVHVDYTYSRSSSVITFVRFHAADGQNDGRHTISCADAQMCRCIIVRLGQ